MRFPIPARRSPAGRATLRSKLPIRSLVSEVFAGLTQRPGRSLLTALGTVLGVGALVAVLGLTATASGQISEQFTILSATEVVVEQVEGGGARYTGGSEYNAFPDDAGTIIESLSGAVHAGIWWTVHHAADERGVSVLPPGPQSDPRDVTTFAVDAGALEAMQPVFSTGRGFDAFHVDRGERVALLSAAAARQLGVSRLDASPAVFIGGQAFTVIGIYADVNRNPEVLLGAMIPSTTAERTFGLPKDPPKMLIETQLGAAQLIGSQAALALRPDNPGLFRLIVPPDPRTLRGNVESDLNTLFLLLAAVSLLIGTFGIANTTLVAVLERVPEIGLRRSVGARPRHIAGQFLAESTAIGTIGGIAGASLGILTIVAVAIAKSWTAIMPGYLPLVAPLIGTITGLLAGLYPAWQSTRIEPAEALRR